MPRIVTVSAEEKIRVVESCLSEKIGFLEASRIAGVHAETMRWWVIMYRTEGPVGFLPQTQNRSYGKETKLAAVEDYLAGRGSLQQICERYQIRSVTQVINWLKVYNRHGDFKDQIGESSMTKSRETTPEERLEVVRTCIAGGNNCGVTALKYQVSYQQVYTWTKKYIEMGEPGLEDRRGRRAGTLPSRTPEEELRDRIAQLERKNFYLEMENELLKK